jgi:iron complex outermembrane receptor protein
LEPRNVDTDLQDKSNRDILYPYQTVNHIKLINNSLYRWEKLRLEFDLGFQRNFRQEWSEYVQHGYMPATFPDTMDFNPNLERQFDKKVYSGKLNFLYPLTAKTQINFGINSENQDNQIDGRGFIIPAYTQFQLGGFAFARHNFSDKSLLQAGIRYDYGHIDTEEYFDWFPSPVVENGDTTWQYLQRAGNINRNFSNLTWSVGYNFNPGKWSYKFNIGKSFRMPIAKELAANGVNYHRFSYEVGDPDLSPEISYQLDAGIEYSSKKFAIGVTPFVNYFLNYIYLNPSSEHDRLYGNGNQIYYYTQSKVFRYGGEIHAHYELLSFLQLGVVGEYVYSEQLSGEKKGFTLPFSPPPSGIFNIKYQRPKLKFVENAYVSFDYRLTAPQNNIVPPEEPTDGYQVFNLGFGGNIIIKNQTINISMQLRNLLNTKYFNHTSYYRLINVPEPGRNFIINISIPFSGRIKQ